MSSGFTRQADEVWTDAKIENDRTCGFVWLRGDGKQIDAATAWLSGAKSLVYPLRLNGSVVQKEQQQEADEESPRVDGITLGDFFFLLY